MYINQFQKIWKQPVMEGSKYTDSLHLIAVSRLRIVLKFHGIVLKLFPRKISYQTHFSEVNSNSGNFQSSVEPSEHFQTLVPLE